MSRAAFSKPDARVSVLIFLVAVGLMAGVRLLMFPHYFIALSYVLPMMVCLWHKDKRLLWLMAIAFAGISTYKAFAIGNVELSELRAIRVQWLMQLTSIGVSGVLLHMAILLQERLLRTNHELNLAKEGLEARNQQIARQNAELQAQAEELASQNEELQQQGEELAQQNEELERQSEELAAQGEDMLLANAELNEREAMLQTILSSMREFHQESEVAVRISEALLKLLGDAASGVGVLDQVGDHLIIRGWAGRGRPSRDRWTLEGSFPQLVLREDRTAFVDDLEARPDLRMPLPEGENTRSIIASPLRYRGKPAGVLMAYADSVRMWTKGEFRIMEWVAAQMSMAMDLSKLQQELVESELRFRTMVDTIPQLAWIAGADGQTLFFNRRWYEYTGTTPESVEGWGWHRVHDPEVLPSVLRNWKDAVATGRPLEMEFPLRAANGQFHWFLTRVVPVRDTHGTVVRWLGTSTDITEKRHAEAALRQLTLELTSQNEKLETLVRERTAKLQEMVDELEHFSYTITHDMRAPLRAMQGFASLLSEAIEQPAADPAFDRAQCIENIRRSAERMDRLITDALSYSRTVKQELPLAPVDLQQLVVGIVSSYPAFQAPRARVLIQGRLPKVMGNEAGLTQCVSNLLGNAIKFVAPGVTPEVRIRAESVDSAVRICFEDNGIGIPKQAHGKIFQMFQRAVKGYEGTGIGLALVKKVTERMGGRVGLDSEPGKGSCFWIELRAPQTSSLTLAQAKQILSSN